MTQTELITETLASQAAAEVPAAEPVAGWHRGHIPALDGLRGIAILMILFLHFNQEALLKLHYPLAGPVITKIAQMGLKGVDLFFVLSGFLITGILLDTKGSTGFFRKFYARRVLRIFPLYYGSLLIVFCIVPWVVTLDAPAEAIAREQCWLWTYLANVPGVSPGWDNSSLFRLGHFWSLCVEEHFYLVWPVIVGACSPRWLLRICLCLIVTALLAGIANAILGNRVFWMMRWTTIRYMDALAIGGLLALIVRQPGVASRLLPWAKRLVFVFGILFVGLGFVPRAFHQEAISLLQKSVSTVLFASILLCVVTASAGSWLGCVLSSRALRTFGKYSYCLYVIHNILLPALNSIFPPDKLIAACRIPILGLAAHMVLAIGACFAIAFISWHLFESQFLKLKRFFEYQSCRTTAPATLVRELSRTADL